jgi:hypothetical protein
MNLKRLASRETQLLPKSSRLDDRGYLRMAVGNTPHCESGSVQYSRRRSISPETSRVRYYFEAKFILDLAGVISEPWPLTWHTIFDKLRVVLAFWKTRKKMWKQGKRNGQSVVWLTWVFYSTTSSYAEQCGNPDRDKISGTRALLFWNHELKCAARRLFELGKIYVRWGEGKGIGGVRRGRREEMK